MSVIKPARHHVTFKTTRLDEMMAWYGTVLGLRLIPCAPQGYAFLSGR
jgi:hypothetical protein